MASSYTEPGSVGAENSTKSQKMQHSSERKALVTTVCTCILGKQPARAHPTSGHRSVHPREQSHIYRTPQGAFGCFTIQLSPARRNDMRLIQTNSIPQVEYNSDYSQRIGSGPLQLLRAKNWSSAITKADAPRYNPGGPLASGQNRWA